MLSGEQLCRIMDEIKQAFILSEDTEITMEANSGNSQSGAVETLPRSRYQSNKFWTSVHGAQEL